MKKLRLLNHYEELTFEKLNAACGSDTYICPKVRLADVFPIKNSGISNEQYSYALKAHFDFLVIDSNREPLFGVEYDGQGHLNDPSQQKKDQIKNSLCDYFELPLLRINSKYINREYKGIDLLSYFVEVWFLEIDFYEAQEAGEIPYDEPFDPCMIIIDGKGKKWPYFISSDIQVKILKMSENDIIKQGIPSYWIGLDNEQNYHCITWLEVESGFVIRVKTRMRNQRFAGIYVPDLLNMISIFDLDRELEKYLNGNIQATQTVVFKSEFDEFCSGLEDCCSSTCGPLE